MSEQPRPDALQAVLWDMDGTIVDTEPFWHVEEHALVARHGGTWTSALATGLVGHDLMTSARFIRDHGPVPLPPEQIVAELLDGVMRRLRAAETAGTVPWRPGARALLGQLVDAAVPSALVTMSYRRLADAVVGGLPPGTFAVTVTGEEVDNGKPHPQPYLAAAAALDVDPARCVAIEDSPTGVASALAAGCMVVGVPHHVPLSEASRLVLIDSLVDVDVSILRRIVVETTHHHAPHRVLPDFLPE